jgi:imidazolonepropionase-like amidohydrolase
MRIHAVAAALIASAALIVTPVAQAPRPAGAVLYEGARLITGEGGPAVERAAFVVENGRFTGVGRQGELQAPPGAARVDLAGKTVIPALIDAHSHIGYMKDLTSGPQNYTRENILDHMRRVAYFGVAASQAMGSDFGELPFQLRDELAAGGHPDAARFLTAGRGLAPLDEISADNMRHAAYVVTTVEGARANVRELARAKVAFVKTWVDSRGGAITPLAPELYRAIIDEAHAHGLRVVVHATGLAEAKSLLRAGIDVFGHMIGDVDEELIALFRQRPNTAILLALNAPRRVVSAPWLNPPHPLIVETVSPRQIARLQGRLASQTPDAIERGRGAWDRLARGVKLLRAAGVKIGVGTDGGGQTGDQFVGWTMHTEMENMVAAGMTPAQVLVAATRTSAEILGLSDLGTVAAGKSADFVVLDANPLDDITQTRRISRVFLRGQEVDRARLRDEWSGDFKRPRHRETFNLGASVSRCSVEVNGPRVGYLCAVLCPGKFATRRAAPVSSTMCRPVLARSAM